MACALWGEDQISSCTDMLLCYTASQMVGIHLLFSSLIFATSSTICTIVYLSLVKSIQIDLFLKKQSFGVNMQKIHGFGL